ncbi:sensor histidine kinase [Algoriphagus aquimarinus]|uniref:histidine kinase n=1 Tax=Algoriphagus aquimarinus TaxID=237018 RepID=A0A1I1C707_9BACT|nr:ATP-binding protein [Algoriphagus aquimarinus]SFB58197.1 His Kinase A (phospho-acceptor) domain-containing protein [Algoriphagus aquimarinus]|tara:strand:- start:36745 stop:37662 length:918 start_codon:yes stop_codon:yes gene_type:complete
MDKVQEGWIEKNIELKRLLATRTLELEKSIKDYQELQEQLLLQEKLASLGQLSAGIAHEIKNPINFINNFSELSIEYVDEIVEEIQSLERNATRVGIEDLLQDIKANLEKILQHGKRADGIVKSMLMHSRGGQGEFVPTNLNSLLQEFVNLAFHGMRAGKNPINVSFEWDLDPEIGPVSIIAEDFSRVIVNLCNNAFDAMRSKFNTLMEKGEDQTFQPVLKIRTRKEMNLVTTEIEDNGAGIPEPILNRILEPFFTTKKAKEGTGLGLSITHDIVKAHKGTLAISSTEGEFTRFEITLPSISSTQ